MKSQPHHRSGRAMIRAGVDVGGTFTDGVVIDEASGAIDQRKVPSDPTKLEVGIVDGLKRLSDRPSGWSACRSSATAPPSPPT